MTCQSLSRGLVVGAVALIAALPAAGQDRQGYRYTDADGRVVYSDRPPTGDAKGLQSKKLGGNFIETSEPAYATRVASEKFPVTLYTFACGETCQSAEALLNGRGVPFAKVDVEDPAGAKKLQELTGELNAPVLQVGDKLVVKGYSDVRWHAMLDEAGYPKSPPRRARPAEPPAGARAAKGPAPRAEPQPAEPRPEPAQAAKAPAAKGNYPQ